MYNSFDKQRRGLRAHRLAVRCCAAAAVVALAVAARGQSTLATSVLAPPPIGYGGAAAPSELPATNQPYGSPPFLGSAPVTPLPDAFRWGPVDFRPHLLYSLTYGNGIQSAPGQQSSSFINTIYPGARFDIGQHWSLDYTPVLRYYSDKRFKNELDEGVTLTGNAEVANWVFGLRQGYADSSSPIIETGAQTEQTSYNTSFTATCALGSKWALELELAHNLNSAVGFASSENWSESQWIDYHLLKQLSLGAGVTLNYDRFNPGTDMKAEDYQGRFEWNPGDKLSIQFSGGIEDRQFVSGGEPDLVSPIYSGSVSYQALRRTSLSLRASRTVNSSLFQNQVLTSTSVAFAVSQLIGQKFTASASVSYANQPYQNIEILPLPTFWIGAPPSRVLTVDRVDKTTTFAVNIDWMVIPRGTVSLGYSISRNESGQSNFQFTSRQATLSLGYAF